MARSNLSASDKGRKEAMKPLNSSLTLVAHDSLSRGTLRLADSLRVPGEGGAGRWWIVGTIIASVALLAVFRLWARPYLRVESEGTIQIGPKAVAGVAASVSRERLEKTVRDLAGFGSRLTGSPGCSAAASYLRAQLGEILGEGAVREETVELEAPFDLGTVMEAGSVGPFDSAQGASAQGAPRRTGGSFRVHPMWAPVTGSYRLPESGRGLGTVVRTSLAGLVAGSSALSGAAVAIPVPTPAELRAMAREAARKGAFAARQRDPLTRGEKAGLERAKPEKADEFVLDVFVEKHQEQLADFMFERAKAAGVRSLLFVEPGPGFRVSPRSFSDRILKHPSTLPRYLVPASRADALAEGAEVRVRQAPAELTADDGFATRVWPLWPNLVRTCSTPRGGLRGKLVWAGSGNLDEVRGRDLRGAIVLMDYNCGYRWVELADLGASAILFAEPDEIMRGESEAKYLSVPADIPRFWIPRSEVAKVKAMDGRTVKLDAQVVWERRPARIVTARLPGTQPGGENEPVIIEAYYDSVSVVPGIAPGAEQAAGAATLLELARVLARHPLKKPVLFVLMPGHAQNMRGWAEYLWRHTLRYRADRRAKPAPGMEKLEPAFVVHLDLTTKSRRLALFYKGYRYDHGEWASSKRVYSSFAKYHSGAAQEVAQALGYGPDFVVDAVNAVEGRTWDSYVPGRFALEQELTLNGGVYGIAWMTPDDERALVDTPQDTPDRSDFGSLAMQARVMACTLPNVLNVGAAFSAARVDNYCTTLRGRVVEFDPRVAYLPDRTVSGALVWVHSAEPDRSMKGVRGDWFVEARGDSGQGGALFELHDLPRADWLASGAPAHITCEAFETDPMDGEVRYAPDRGPQGTQQYIVETDMNAALKELMLVVFPCRSLLMYDLTDPLSYGAFARMSVLDANTDSEPPVFGQSLPEANWFSSRVEPLAVAYAPEGMKGKFTFVVNMMGKRAALVNAAPGKPEGTGYSFGGAGRINFTALRVASDLQALNELRIGNLKRHGIVNHFMEDLHAAAGEHLATAKRAMEKLDWRPAVAEARAAWGLAARVYPDVETMAKDVVTSAMLFLALLIPFAFLAERLLLAFPDVTRQVGGVAAVFLAMFAALRAVHPAFQIALTPVMILVAFILIALSLIVTGIIGARFFDFLREEREQSQGTHRVEVSQVSVGMAAFSIGVSNMRKRVLRTALTCMTLVVLTFAVLSLTSVLTTMKQRKFPVNDRPAYTGLMFRSPLWAALGEPVLRHLEIELGGKARPVARAWHVSYVPDKQNSVEVVNGDRGRATAVAALGLTDREPSVTGVDRTLVAGEWFRPGDERACILPAHLAAALKLGPEDVGKTEVVIFGVSCVVRGLFDAGAFGKLRDLDGEGLAPVNFEVTARRARNENIVMNPEGRLPKRYDHHDPTQTVILPYATLIRLGGRLASVAVPMRGDGEVKSAITGLLSRLGLLVYAGLEGRTWAYSAIGGTTAGGLDFLLVPVLVAALIVFSTMLGAVQERTREIGVYSSVGLAPNHVAVLFLAEACVYAVLGTVVGYLLGQAFSLLIVHGGILPGLNVNYSSNSTIMSVLIVMAVVLLSTIYPARLASRLARPSQVTGFVMPALAGDEVNLELPFSFNARDAQAVTVFLAEWFDAHAEASAGDFSSGNMRMKEARERGRSSWELRLDVWLAPYDFGVSQELVFRVREGIGDESSAMLAIIRHSGDQASWRRVNARFLKAIRKQFLIWRSLGEPARAAYFKRAAAALAAAPAGRRGGAAKQAGQEV